MSMSNKEYAEQCWIVMMIFSIIMGVCYYLSPDYMKTLQPYFIGTCIITMIACIIAEFKPD